MLFEPLNKVCLMIGPHRSGSSVIRGIIDAHPMTAMGHELGRHGIYQRLINGIANRDELFRLIVQQQHQIGARPSSEHLEKNGRTTYSHAMPGTWQGRFKQLKVIGDKSGPWIGAIADDKGEFDKRLRSIFKVPVFYVHTVRNPWDNFATMKIAKQDISLFERWCAGAQLVHDAAPERVHTVHMDDLSEDPAVEVEKIYRFLNLGVPKDIVDACAARVFAKPHRRALEMEWKEGEIEKMRRIIAKFPWLSRYPENPDG